MAARKSEQSDLWQHVATFSGLGFVLFSSIGGGYFLGWLVDRWLRSTPVCALIGAGLGLAGGLTEILQIMKRVEERDRRDGTGSAGP